MMLSDRLLPRTCCLPVVSKAEGRLQKITWSEVAHAGYCLMQLHMQKVIGCLNLAGEGLHRAGCRS